jgi:hypothetical protein
MGGIRETFRTNHSIAPGLPQNPCAGINSIGSLTQVFFKNPFRLISSPTVLIYDDITPLHEERRDFSPGFGLINRSQSAFRAAVNGFPIGSSLQYYRKLTRYQTSVPGRTVDIGRQENAIAHPYHDIFFHSAVVFRALIQDRITSFTLSLCTKDIWLYKLDDGYPFYQQLKLQTALQEVASSLHANELATLNDVFI